MTTQAVLDEILGAVEQTELRGLMWGDVDGAIGYAQMLEIIAAKLSELGRRESPDDVLEDLVGSQAVFELPGDDDRYRSRFAEMTRILVRLRQMFRPGDWAAGPNLVSDFRVHHEPRRYPKRVVPAMEALRAASHSHPLSPLQRKIWEAATMRNGEPLQLARFQVDAAIGILRSTKASNDTATIITAGTGSGKTLAFYLPTLLRVGELIRNHEHCTKALVIYPRTELLKDQFAETYDLARRIDAVLQERGLRPLSIGALFSNVPNTARDEELAKKGWRRVGSGFECPLLRCRKCGSGLVWTDEALAASRRELCCRNRNCSAPPATDIEIRLTRKDVEERPPDILFTTTEMLNQRLSDPGMRHIFGVDCREQRLRLVLLDEVHTYSGTSGAQTALTLRRWRHAVRTPMTWVGLSATLEEPSAFFSDLTGVPEHAIAVGEPQDFIEEGASYQLLLKADPSEMTSVLSTSIQAVMATARLSDRPERRGASRFGRRLFVFTDDLDVTNRLFDDIRDAEGHDIFGRPRRDPLAALRALRNGPDEVWSDILGQRWWAAERLGWDLREPLRITRTTSTDRGVDLESDVVVATAALEVGINDPEVGTVLQHKAPRDLAAYVQRKGRAGRDRRTRSTLITVLSDYGRDRIAFQQYEHLFSPRIPARRLPIRNQYVLRMQAVNATLDWLSQLAQTRDLPWAWWVLSGPAKLFAEGSRPKLERAQQTILRTVLRPLLREEGPLRSSLRTHLGAALGIDAATVEDLLWQPPRSLLLEVLPTLSRRLFSHWALQAAEGKLDHHVDFHPLPDFIPRNLFSELSLPEVSIRLPPATVNAEPKTETMSMVSALRHLAPGRVTRRFAEERGKLSHWIPVAIDQPIMRLSVERYAVGATAVTEAAVLIDGAEQLVAVHRPWQIELEVAKAADARPETNSHFEWHSRFSPHGEPAPLPLPGRSPWRAVLGEPRVFLHRFDANVSVTRYAHRAVANIINSAGRTRVEVRLHEASGKPAAVGFEIEVDALRVQVDLSKVGELAASLGIELLADMRTAYFRDLVLNDAQLPNTLGGFDREALRELLVAALLRACVNGADDLPRALEKVRSSGLDSFADDLFEVRFGDALRAPATPAEDGDADDEPAPSRRPPGGRARRRLDHVRDLAHDGAVVGRLYELAKALWDPEPAPFEQWLRNTLVQGLANAVLQACIHSAPLYAVTDSLLVDCEMGNDHETTIWVTESTLGGGGVLDAIADRFHADPNAFPTALEAVLAPADMERSADALMQVAEKLQADERLRDLVRDLRASLDPTVRAGVREALFEHLTEGGLAVGHSIAVSLQARLFRPGSNAAIDRVILACIQRWDQLQARLGIGISLSEFAYAASWDAELVETLLRAAGRPRRRHNAFTLIEDLLWPRGGELRSRLLDHYHPFRSSTTTSDPGLLRAAFVHSRRREVSIQTPEWRRKLVEVLQQDGSARLTAGRDADEELRVALVELLATPVDCEYLQFFPTVERIERANDGCVAVVSLLELL